MSVPGATIPLDAYGFPELETLSSPRLLVYEAMVEENLARVRGELESVTPGGGLAALRPHAKTHKSLWAVRRQMEHGVRKFKCTPNELDMLLEAGAGDIFVAYPPLPHLAARLARAVSEHPHVRIAAQIASLEHARVLADAARAAGVEIECSIDLDVGAHRTGIAPESAADLARAVSRTRECSPLRIRGLHAYDGHNHAAAERERAACARAAAERVISAMRDVERAGVTIERVCAGGSPGFLPAYEALVSEHRAGAEVEVEVSPGTFIYWDTKYDALMPGRYRLAALILSRVMDLPADDLVTLDLGYKRWAVDQGPVELFSAAGLEVVQSSEEHTVLRQTGRERPAIGDPVLIAPRHVCATVNLWEDFTLVPAAAGEPPVVLPVRARNR